MTDQTREENKMDSEKKLTDCIAQISISIHIEDIPTKRFVGWSPTGSLDDKLMLWTECLSYELNQLDFVEVTNSFEMCEYICMDVECSYDEIESKLEAIMAVINSDPNMGVYNFIADNGFVPNPVDL